MEKGYLIEFHQVGNAVKVSAVDPRTLTEVSIVGSPDSGEEELKRAAVRKLEYVLRKKELPEAESGARNGGAGKGPGLLV